MKMIKALYVECRKATLKEKIKSFWITQWVSIWEVEGRCYKVFTMTEGGEWTSFRLAKIMGVSKYSLIVVRIKSKDKEV